MHKCTGQGQSGSVIRSAGIFLGLLALGLSLLMTGFFPLRICLPVGPADLCVRSGDFPPLLVCLGAADLRVLVGAVRRALREGGAAAAAAAAAVPASRAAPEARGFSCGCAALSRDTTCRD